MCYKNYHTGHSFTPRPHELLNDIELFLGTTISEDVLTKVKASPVYCIIIDETIDISMREQMIVYVKILDQKLAPQTLFLSILQVSVSIVPK